MHHHPITIAGDAGTQDAMVWLAIAEQDPDAAVQFYDGLANKLARIAWSVLNSGKDFDWKEKELATAI